MRVSGIEHDFLSVARAAVGALPVRAVASIVAKQASRQDALDSGLGARALRCFEQTLARGCSLQLLRRGGWRSGTFFGDRGSVRRGRLWEQAHLPPLRFTRYSYELCRFLTISAPPMRPSAMAPDGAGDELFAYLIADMICALGMPLDRLGPMLEGVALAQLAFPHAMEAAPSALLSQPLLLEALQLDLARQLLRLESLKQSLGDPQALAAIGRRQEERLGMFVDEAERTGRVDLLSFVVEATAILVHVDGRCARLDPQTTLAARHGAREAAAGVMRIAQRVSRLHARMRLVGFVDEGYDQAQALLGAWQRHEPALSQVGEALEAWTAL